MFFGTKNLYLDSNCLFCDKNWTSTPSASGSYGRQTGWQVGSRNIAGFQNLENSLQVKLFGFLLNQGHTGRRPAHTWFLKIDLVRIVSMHVCVCVCPRPRLLITNGTGV